MRQRSLVLACAACLGACTSVSYPPGAEWAPATVPEWAHQGRFAITDNLSDQLSFVTDSNPSPALLANMPVGDVPVELEGPHHLDVTPDGKYIVYNLSNYVPGTGSGPHGSHGLGTVPGSLVKIDAVTTQKVGEVIVDRSPGDVILSPDGQLAFVTHYDLLKVQEYLTNGGSVEDSYSTVAIVDVSSMARLSLTPVCPTAHGEGLSADQKTLYVVCAQSDELVVLDVSDPRHPAVQKRLPVGPTPGRLGAPAYFPYALAVHPVDGTVWISDNNSADVRVYDPAAGAMDPTRVISVGGVAMFGIFTADGKTFYVPHQGDDRITRVDVATLETRDLIPPQGSCKNMHLLKMAPGEKNAVLVCEGDHVTTPGTVVNIDMVAFAATGFTQVGFFPDGAVWLPAAP